MSTTGGLSAATPTPSPTESETTVTFIPTVPTHPRSAIVRIWNVVRMHLVDRWTYFGTPWLIVGIAFAITVVIWQIIRFSDGSGAAIDTEGLQVTGAILAPMWYLMVVAIQAITRGFPFAQGFSVTRRDFYLGTSLLFVMISAVNSIAFTVLGQLEELTNGWGIDTFMFNSLWFGIDAWYVDLLAFFVMQMLVMFIGASVATIFMRWKMNGMLVFFTALALVLVGLIALITFTGSWPVIGAWFPAQGIAGVFAWLLIPTVLAGFGGFLALRRATPSNS